MSNADYGIESYPLRTVGGQHTGMSVGIRMWYPKNNKESPTIDIRIDSERSQLRNKQLAESLMDLVLKNE